MIKDLSFRGHPYKIACYDTRPQHPSWYTFEDEVSVRDAVWDVKPGDVVLDVGAAYGSYTLTALACGAAYVHSWSPLEGYPGELHSDTLRQSLVENGWSGRCSVYEVGVYDRVGWLSIGTQEFFESPREGRPDVIQVATLDLWAMLSPVRRVDWMKLDVEGAEVEVVLGGRDLIGRFRPRILIENHLFKRPDVVRELREALVGGLGYREAWTAPYGVISHTLYEFTA